MTARLATTRLLYDLIEEAAAKVADPANQPVYFHCHHGINRASMVHMAYRMLYCGYTIDEAEAEVARQFGLRQVDKGPDYRHMRGFYETRVLPRRLAQADADSQSQNEQTKVASDPTVNLGPAPTTLSGLTLAICSLVRFGRISVSILLLLELDS